MDPATIAIVAGLGFNLAGTAIDWGSKVISDNEKRKSLRIKEMFHQNLIKVQKTALQSQFARQNFQSVMNENLALGGFASSLSKSRIGVAGTAPVGLQTIMQRYDFERDGYALMINEQTAKQDLNFLSSKLAVQGNQYKGMGDRLGDLWQGFTKGFEQTLGSGSDPEIRRN